MLLEHDLEKINEGEFNRSIAALKDVPPFPIERIPLEYLPAAA